MLTIDEMIDHIKNVSEENDMRQTLIALPYAISMHEGQYRKGKEKIPYIMHPLLIACHAISLGLVEDELIATILLHDVCEDCFDEDGEHIKSGDLPVLASIQRAVELLSKPEHREGDWEARYYHGIETDRLAIITKLLDRCNNISSMTKVYSPEKMTEYIATTEKYVMPYIDIINDKYPELKNMTFVVEYQMESIINALK